MLGNLTHTRPHTDRKEYHLIEVQGLSILLVSTGECQSVSLSTTGDARHHLTLFYLSLDSLLTLSCFSLASQPCSENRWRLGKEESRGIYGSGGGQLLGFCRHAWVSALSGAHAFHGQFNVTDCARIMVSC